MEEEEPEETNGSGKKVPLSRIAALQQVGPNGSGSGSEKITSSSENEVEEIPKDEDPAAQAQQLAVHALPPFGRSRTFDGGVQQAPPAGQPNSGLLGRHGRGRFALSSRSPHSSSSQEDYEPAPPRQHLLVAAAPQPTARSMESLRSASTEGAVVGEDSRSLESLCAGRGLLHGPHQYQHQQHHHHHHRSFLTASRLDVRRIQVTESRSSENLVREESLKAEVRRGLFASTDRSKLAHLSLPPPGNFISLTSPGGSDRRITILSPHSPQGAPDFQQAFLQAQTLKSRRKKAIVLPRLVVPHGESPVFE